MTITRDLLRHRRPGRALKEMEEFLPNFDRELQEFIYKKIQKEAESVKLEKETCVADFCRKNLSSFSYETYHDKLLNTTSLLTAAIRGAVINLPFSEIKVNLHLNNCQKFPIKNAFLEPKQEGIWGIETRRSYKFEASDLSNSFTSAPQQAS